ASQPETAIEWHTEAAPSVHQQTLPTKGTGCPTKGTAVPSAPSLASYSNERSRTAKLTGLDSKLETPAQIFLQGKLLSLKSYRNFSNLFAHTDKCKNEPSPFLIKALQPQSPGSQTFTMWPLFGIRALLVVTVTLSPVTAAARSGNDVTGEDVYPPLWDLAPENLLDFPVKDSKIVINAWNYQDRLGVYKSLLNASAKYFSAFGSQNSGNILWGLPLQHGWQFRTGMNYYLAIIPFLGAVEAGLFGELPYEIEILPPEEQKDDFCYSVKDCWSRMPKLMDDWKAYFEAHTTSIAYALPTFQDSLKYLSGPEANFGEDWANAVDFIAATHFSTDFPTTNNFQAFLPQRMLVEGDVIPFISDFSPEQNKVLVTMRALHRANKLT
ncbi:Protein LEG1, partial [Lamprotornis superbus]